MPLRYVIKRDGTRVPFERERIARAVYAAARAVGNGESRPWAETISWAVTGILEERFGRRDHPPHVEEIQDVVEEVLIKSGKPQIAKAYILYRQKRAEARQTQQMLLDTEKLVDDYLQRLDWRVNENSNMNYSLQGLNFYLASSIAARYWLNKIYPPEVQRAHIEGDLHIHDLGMLSGYTYYGQEVVVVKDRTGIKLTSFEALYADCPEPEKPLSEQDGAWVKYPRNCFVLDRDGWTRVLRLVRKRKDRPMHWIRNRGGRSVIVTDNHPLITREGEKVAAETGPQDALYTVDLNRLLAGEIFSETEVDLLAALRQAGVTRFGHDQVCFNGIPIADLDTLPTEEGIVHTSTQSMPRRVPLTEEFGHLVGFVLAEGSLSHDEDAPRTIGVTQEAAILHQINRPLIAPGTPGCVTRRPDREGDALQVRNAFLRFLFEHVFDIRPGAHHKSLPVHILQYNQEFVRGLLAGIMDGDGSVQDGELVVRSSSRTLLEQMACVLSLLGATPRDRNVEGVEDRRVYRGREGVRRFPLYVLAFHKTADLTLPSSRFQAVDLSSQVWQDESRDAWHTVLNNEPIEIPDDEIYDLTTESGTLVVNGMWNHNCTGWDLQDLLITGFGGVPAKIESKPPRHLRTALGQLVNFFYTLQGEIAGAVAVSNFDTLLAPFIRYDGLDERGIKQAVQEFVFNINVPTRVGFQSLVWDELVVIRRSGRIGVTEIGRLVDEQFERNRQRVLSQGNDSYAVANAEDIQALAFDRNGRAVWAPVKAFVRHRVPDGATFLRVRTGRGTAQVSPAHSLFAFETLDGRPTIRPMTAQKVEVAPENAQVTPTNHVVALRRVPNGGTREQLDLAELIDAVPQVAEQVRVRLPDEAARRLRERAREHCGGMPPFYPEYGSKDRDRHRRRSDPEKGTLPYPVWRAFGDEAEAEFSLQNGDLWYSRTWDGEELREFIRLLAWYIGEGHNDVPNGLFGQVQGDDQEENDRSPSAPAASGHPEEMQGYSSQGHPTGAALRMAGKGLPAALIGHLGGTYSTNKVIPWFVYDLSPALQETFLVSLWRRDAAESTAYFDYTTTSRKLSLGLSLLLAMNGYEFSVYEVSPDRETGNDQYILRVYQDKKAGERYAVEDLLARVCLHREAFSYSGEYEYDLSVDLEMENFAGGSGLLCFHNTPFTNITMDLTPPSTLRDQAVIIGGELKEATYGEFQREMDLLNRAFAEIMLEGDAKGRVHTFPIPTYNVTSDFDWENPALEPVWRMTARYGIPYWANFINSNIKPEDARSMCCRLRLDNRELRRRLGGLFAAAPLTGSVGVVTINMPRLTFLSESEAEFRERLERLMEIARTSLEIKRKVLEQLTERRLYPYCRFYLRGIKQQTGAYWSNHFSTIGLIGMHEACLNLLGVGIEHPEGKAFAIRTLRFMLEVLARFQEETGNLYNLEATPAEGASFRLARADRQRFPRILTSGTGTAPYYTNSTHLAVSYSDDLFEVLEHQDDLQTLYTGGTVVHIFLGEELHDWQQARRLVRRVAENFHLPYFTLTPTFSVCPVHGYISGKHEYCPYEHTEEELARFGSPVLLQGPSCDCE